MKGHSEDIPKIERLMNLVCFLYKISRPATINEIRSRVRGYTSAPSEEALRQRLHRDKAELEKMGIYIRYVPDEGYTVDDRSKLLPEIHYTPDEKLVLMTMIRSLEKGKGFLFEEDLRTAAMKISLGAGIYQVNENELPELGFFSLVEPEEEEKITFLLSAVEHRKRIKFLYQPPASETVSKREVAPLGLFFRGGSWYLVGLIRTGEERVYRLERMKELEYIFPAGHGGEYEIPEGFDISIYANRKPWTMEETRPFKVRVFFSSKVWVMGLREFQGAKIIEKRNNGTLLEIEVSSTKGFIRNLLKYGADATVVEPDWIKKQVVERIEKLKGLLGGSEKSDQ